MSRSGGRLFFRTRLNSPRLLVDLVVDGLRGLILLGVEIAAQPGEGLVADDEAGGDGGLALGDEALLVGLLVLGGVDLEDVVLALEALVVGQQDQTLGLVVEVVGGLLDHGESLVDAVERLVAKVVDPVGVGSDVLKGLGEPGDHGSSKGLVSRVAELDGPLAQLVGLEGVNTIMDDGVVEQVLQSILGQHPICALVPFFLFFFSDDGRKTKKKVTG